MIKSPLDNIMRSVIKGIGAQAKGNIYESSSDISPNWEDIRTKFGYTMLSAIAKRVKL